MSEKIETGREELPSYEKALEAARFIYQSGLKDPYASFDSDDEQIREAAGVIRAWEHSEKLYLAPSHQGEGTKEKVEATLRSKRIWRDAGYTSEQVFEDIYTGLYDEYTLMKNAGWDEAILTPLVGEMQDIREQIARMNPEKEAMRVLTRKYEEAKEAIEKSRMLEQEGKYAEALKLALGAHGILYGVTTDGRLWEEAPSNLKEAYQVLMDEFVKGGRRSRLMVLKKDAEAKRSEVGE